MRQIKAFPYRRIEFDGHQTIVIDYCLVAAAERKTRAQSDEKRT